MTVGQCRLAGLNHEDVDIPQEQVAKRGALHLSVVEFVRLNAKRKTRRLDQAEEKKVCN
jgi:hypothetical protein